MTIQDTSAIKVSALYEVQKNLDASFTAFDGWWLPKNYGSPSLEYKAAQHGLAVTDRSLFGRLRISGIDALDLLNRLSSNKLIQLPTRKGVSTVLTTNKGRIIDLLIVINMGNELMVITSPQTPDKVIEWIDMYTFGEDIAIENATEDTVLLSLMGPDVKDVLGIDATSLELFGVSEFNCAGMQLPVIKTDYIGISSYDLIATSSQAENVWNSLIRAGAVPVGTEALEMIRVEHGVPRYGSELGEEFNPLEAGLNSSISYDKGCYIGQEVVLRLNTYDKVQKHLTGIAIEDGKPEVTAHLEVDGNYAGFLTSVIASPMLGHTLALGYLRTKYLSIGQDIEVRVDDRLVSAKLVDLPVKS